MRGREALRGLLQDGKVTMHPQDDGSYVAEFGFLPMVIVEAGRKANAIVRTRAGHDPDSAMPVMPRPTPPGLVN
jgi:hypothetical protein